MRYGLVCLLLLISACKGGGGASKLEDGSLNEGQSSILIELIDPISIPSLDSTPTIRISGLTPNESIGVYSDSSCTSQLASGTPADTSLELTLSTLPVGETKLYVKGSGSCSSLLYTYRYGFKLSGNLTYDFVPVNTGSADYANTTQKPLRNIYVELRSQSDDSVIDSLNTNDLGAYEFYVTSSSGVYLAVWAEMKSPSVIVEDNTNSNAQYVVVSSNYSLTNDQVQSLNIPSGWSGSNASGSYTGGRYSAPFAILDSVYSTIKKIKTSRPSASFPALKINWSVNNVAVSGNKALGQISTSHFSSADQELYILGKADSDTDEFDKHIIVHEWGHYFENQLSRSDSTGGSHSSGDIKDMTLAFGEGWGNALSAMVFDPDIRYVDTSGSRQQTTSVNFSLESSTDTNKGWFSEVSVQEMLFDIYDSTNESGDSLSLGIGPIYDVMIGHQKNTSARTSIFSFITGLKALNSSYSTALNTLASSKNITPISDDYGSTETHFAGWTEMSSVYQTLVAGGSSVTTKLWGSGMLQNDMANSRYIRFTATSSVTILDFQGDDSFIIDIYNKGNKVVDGILSSVGFICTNGSSSGTLSVNFPTTPGQEYIIRVYTDNSFVYYSGYYVNIQTQLQSL